MSRRLPTVGTPSSTGESFLIVFDFDDTIIRGNSDELIPNALGVGEKMRLARESNTNRLQWTNLLSEVMSPFCSEDVIRILPTAVKMEPEMKELFEMLDRLRVQPAAVQPPLYAASTNPQIEHAKSVQVDFVVASDANTLFVSEAFRQLLGVTLASDKLFSNPFVDLHQCGEQTGCKKKSRVDWFMPVGTNPCPCCSTTTPNMCKSVIVQDALNASRMKDVTIVYVGNGSNDACPIRNVLRARDHALILRGDRLEKVLQRPVSYPVDAGCDGEDSVIRTFPESLWANGGAGVCNHHMWNDAAELSAIIHHLLGQPTTTAAITPVNSNGFIRAAPLPPLALFDGEGGVPNEFRIKRLWNDIPALYDRLIVSIREIITRLERAAASSSTSEAKKKDAEDDEVLCGWRLGLERVTLQRKSLLKDGTPSWLVPCDDEVHSDSTTPIHTWLDIIGSPEILPVPLQVLNFGDHWTQTPWLHGEIYMSVLHWHVLQHAIRSCSSDAPVTAAPKWYVDGFQSPSLPTILIKKHHPSTTSAPILEVAKTSALDVYETEKDTAVDAFALSHIFPMVSIVFTDIGLVSAGINKMTALEDDGDAIAVVEEEVWGLIERTIESLLMACTWGNAVDLAMFSNEELVARHLSGDDEGVGKEVASSEDAKRAMAEEGQRAKMAANSIPEMAQYIVDGILRGSVTHQQQQQYIDIVQDNCGVECCADMLFALYVTHVSNMLTASKCRSTAKCSPVTVRLHTKPISYFVSDVMPKDVDRMIDSWEASGQPSVISASALFRTLLVHCDGGSSTEEGGQHQSSPLSPSSGHVEVHSHPFWVFPAENADMPASLARQFFFSKTLSSSSPSSSLPLELVTALSSLVIFKGDLNFRRVCGDRHWNTDMFFKLTQYAAAASGGAETDDDIESPSRVNVSVPFTAVLDHYWPYQSVPIAALRTNKSELCIGVSRETMDRLDADVGPAGWRFSGSYAVALFAQ